VENTSDAILLIDVHGVIRYWNRGAECMFQYARAEVVGQRIGFLLPPDLQEADELGALQERIDREGQVTNFGTRRVRKDGTELWVSVTRTVLHDSHGRAIGSTAIIRDVSDLHEKEEELLSTRTLAVVGQLAAKIAHEIKNPLAGISGAIQVLARGLDPGDERREVFENVRQEVERLDATVQDLLRFARPVPPKLAATGLAVFVRDVVESAGLRHALQETRFDVEIPEDLVLPIDQRLMSEVLANLIHNASHATHGRGTIRVSAEPAGDAVAIDLTDTGVGIPADVLPSIFEPFFTTKSRGTGLGLAIARKNVEAHGGRIEVESTPGEGARFRITLPLRTPEGRPPA
jgi:PAS domain S-box-containing protein